MKHVFTSKDSERSATLAPTLWLVLGCSVLCMVTTYATAPGWWSSRGAVVSNTSTNAVVVEGQLKFFTQKAVDELNAHLTNATLSVGGAGDDLGESGDSREPRSRARLQVRCPLVTCRHDAGAFHH